MRFWDSSALVPLLVTESASGAVTAELKGDPEVITWWASQLECTSALARLERDGSLDASATTAALVRLAKLAQGWSEILPASQVRSAASRLLRVHPLRAVDALQLAAAIAASENQPQTLAFVTLDDRLAQAAEREGFPVLRPGVPAGASG